MTSNLNQKVQDQLVLIEEIFSKSKFTENILSGKLYEVISLINELDEERILNTDILGDAIESALSETGGTKDIGLNRTPDHIRHMMVAMCEPEYKDTIFDPACGTGGFLFDSFQYVIEKTTRNGKWPGSNAHKEIQQFFTEYFKNNKLKIPTIPESNQFYRSGVGGIEYMGRIRKMAAINLYIRGLNPANILQGDSLHLYKPEVYENSKTCIIANPPFGAKKDQEAYPNVWDEYSKEGETTILFVKMMLDTLAPGGRCSVIVSEGFLTWGQNSARALRNKLLTETNLKAVISLPQGLFVSKSGQGAKTSLLYFEKGVSTKSVWFYKMTNDGFALGVNREEQVNSQIPEILNTFLNQVKKGETPVNTANSFSIPASWILEIDPRIKERIAKEKKSGIEEKELPKINEIKDKEKKKEKLIALESKIRNEIAKEIEKKHVYSYNMATYRSSLSKDQLKKWNIEIKFEKTGKSIDDRYSVLKNINEKNEKQTLSLFDITHSLELDMVREYLAKIQAKSKLAQSLLDIVKEENKIEKVKLGNHIRQNENKIKPFSNPDTKYTILGVSKEIGVFVNEDLSGEDIKQSYYVVNKNEFCYNPYRINVGSIAKCSFDLPNQIISGAYVIFSVDENSIMPDYLDALFGTKIFLDFVNERATGGVRMNFKYEDMCDWQIPLPPLEKQAEIVAEVSRLKRLIKGCEEVSNNFSINFNLFNKFETQNIRDFAILNPKKDISISRDGFVTFVPMEAVDDKSGAIINPQKKTLYEVSKGYTYFSNDDVIFAKITPCMENGKSAVASKLINNIGFGSTEFHVIRANQNKVLPKYIYYIVRSEYFREIAKSCMTGSSGHKRVPVEFLEDFKWPVPGIESQKQIVSKLDKQMEVLEGVRDMKNEAQKEIELILARVWGEDKK